MKIKIVARGGRLYGYGAAAPRHSWERPCSEEGQIKPEVEAKDLLENAGNLFGKEDVERICEIGRLRKLAREAEIREAVRAEREREIREHIARQREKKARRAEKVEQVLGWVKTGAMILALIAGAVAVLWMMAGQVWAAAGMLPMLAVGGRMQ